MEYDRNIQMIAVNMNMIAKHEYDHKTWIWSQNTATFAGKWCQIIRIIQHLFALFCRCEIIPIIYYFCIYHSFQSRKKSYAGVSRHNGGAIKSPPKTPQYDSAVLYGGGLNRVPWCRETLQ